MAIRRWERATTSRLTEIEAERFRQDLRLSAVGTQRALGLVDLEPYATTTYVDSAIAAAIIGALIFQGGWDASSGAFPGTVGLKQGWFYKVTVAGTVDGVSFSVGDDLYALIDTASTTTYAGNWLKVEGAITASEVNTALGYTAADAATLSAHTANTSNPHSVTKAQVGLGNCDNTSDALKPVSTAQAAADAAVQSFLTAQTGK